MTLSAVLSLGALRRLTPRRPRSPRWSVCVSTARDTAWSMGVSVQTQVRVCATVRAPVCRSAEVERRGYRRLSQRLPGSDGAPALHTRVACSEGPGVPLGELHGGRGWSACIWLGGDSDRPCPSQHALLCHRGHPARHHVCLVSFLTGGRAWWAAVYGVAQSGTRLKQLGSSSSSNSSLNYVGTFSFILI